MKLKFFLVVLSFASVNAVAQDKLSDKYKKGEIVLNDDSRIQGYIFFDFEWVSRFQNSVSYINQQSYDNLLATGKVKMKEVEKLNPKEVKYYQLEGGSKFVTETYADLTAAGTGSLPKKYFLEQVADGKIRLYKKYASLEGVVSGPDAQLAMEGGEKLAERNRSTYDLLIIKDSKNVKDLANINLLDYISDNPSVLEKFNNDEYGNLKSVFSTKVKLNFDGSQHEADLIRLISDYNKG